MTPRLKLTAGLLAGLAAVTTMAAAVLPTTAAAAAVPAALAGKPARAASSTATATTLAGGAQSRALAKSTVSQYWTAARMRSATMLTGLTAPAAASVAALHATGAPGTVPAARPAGIQPAVNASITVGRVFFYNPTATANVSQGNHSCSASALNSNSKQLVITAGHCVEGGAGGSWYQNWVFVPYYNNGAQPYGQFAAEQFRSFTSWINSSDLTRDVGLVTTWPNNLGKVVNVVGGNGLSWNWPKSLAITILGYPADPPYNGTWQQYCAGTTSDWGSRIALHCGFTGGSSGSPWLKDYNGSLGNVDGDMSTLDSNGWNASPYYDDAVKSMFDAQGNVT